MDLKHIERSNICPNCATVLDSERDNFCPVCGQLNNIKKETAFELVKELVSDFLHFDSKVVRSIKPLLISPGKLTVDYINGKRARFFHPVRFFLIVTVIMFLVQGLTSHEKEVKLSKDDPSHYTFSVNTEDGIQVATDTVLEDIDRGIVWELGDTSISNDTLVKYIKNYGITDTRELMDTLKIRKNLLSKLLISQIIKSNTQGFDKLSDYIKHKLPWVIFALMPVFAFVMWAFYVRRKIYFSDHLIYAFHLHTAMFMIISLIMILGLVSDWAGKLGLLIPVYYYASLKKVYSQSWLKTIIKGTLIGVVYTVLGFITIGCLMLILVLMF